MHKGGTNQQSKQSLNMHLAGQRAGSFGMQGLLQPIFSNSNDRQYVGQTTAKPVGVGKI